MTDTPPEVSRIHREMLMSRPGAERFMMGFDMFATACRMMMANLRAASPDRLRERAFLRLYGADFAPDERQRIATAIRKYEQAKTPASGGTKGLV